MADTSRPYELVLLGANGYTGKMTAEHIARYLPTDLKWAIAGRNSKKLADGAEELKKLNPDRLQPCTDAVPFHMMKMKTHFYSHRNLRIEERRT